MLLREQLNFNLLHSDLQNLPPTASSECMAIKNPPIIQDRSPSELADLSCIIGGFLIFMKVLFP